MPTILWNCVYCGSKDYTIENKPTVNWWEDYVQSVCCGRRYTLDRLYIENPDDNVNEDQDQIESGEIKGIIY